MGMTIPADVRAVLAALETAGYEAWCVGGCVRDLLLGEVPEDWDVTTSAPPEATLALFAPHAIPTGLRHGTVTVVTEARRVEATTFRLDGDYSDHRRPDGVIFTRSLEEDLRRRDFTVNAMALSGTGELRDLFDGRRDLEARAIRCVGEPDRRFGEDALRIMRGLRFAAALDFAVEAATADSLRRNRDLLKEIAPERLRVELEKLLAGKAAGRVLREFPEVLGVFLPELLPMIGFDQRNPHHCYDVWEHTVHAVEAAPRDGVLRLAMLLHDLGKPSCFTLDENGVGHFYGHPAVSRKLAADILGRLKFDNHRKETILTLVEHHDRPLPQTEKGVRRFLREFGEENARLLLEVQRADALATARGERGEKLKAIGHTEELLEEELREASCFSLRQLAVNGRDLTALGLSGPEIGRCLAALLDDVVEGRLPNHRKDLLDAVPGKMTKDSSKCANDHKLN